MIPRNQETHNTVLYTMRAKPEICKSHAQTNDSLYIGRAYDVFVNYDKRSVELSTYTYNMTYERGGMLFDYDSAVYTRTTKSANDISPSVGMTLGYGATLCDSFASYLIDSEQIIDTNITAIDNYVSDVQNLTISHVLTKYRDLIAENSAYTCAASLFSSEAYQYSRHVHVNMVHDCTQLCIYSVRSNERFSNSSFKISSYIRQKGLLCAYDIFQEKGKITTSATLTTVEAMMFSTMNITYDDNVTEVEMHTEHTENVTTVPTNGTDANLTHDQQLVTMSSVISTTTRAPRLLSESKDDNAGVSTIFGLLSVVIVFVCLIVVYITRNEGALVARMRDYMERLRTQRLLQVDRQTLDAEIADNENENINRVACRAPGMKRSMRVQRLSQYFCDEITQSDITESSV